MIPETGMTKLLSPQILINLLLRTRVTLILIRCSAKPLQGHHTLVWMVSFGMAGFVLSGSGIRVFVLGNMGLGW